MWRTLNRHSNRSSRSILRPLPDAELLVLTGPAPLSSSSRRTCHLALIKRIGGLHDAKSYLERALSDLKEAESDTAVCGDRQQAVEHVNAALNSVNAGIEAYQDGK